ncbi:MAG: hypothetical protein AAF399_17130 [Bacteroidota bacterium]
MLFILIGLAILGFAAFVSVSIQSEPNNDASVVLDNMENLIEMVEGSTEQELANQMTAYEQQYQNLAAKISSHPIDTLTINRKQQLDRRFESARVTFRLKERRWIHTLDETERWMGRLEDSTVRELGENWDSIEARFQETQTQIESNWDSMNDSQQDTWQDLRRRYDAIEEKLPEPELAHA